VNAKIVALDHGLDDGSEWIPDRIGVGAPVVRPAD